MNVKDIIRIDMGTENRHVEQMQIFFRRNDNEHNIPAFLYGTSTANQKIKCWWATLRQHNTEFLINLFRKIKDDGYFNGSYLDKSLIQYCFLRIIQNELKKIVLEWNCHSITASRNSILPRGRPLLMYNIPELYKARNFLQTISQEELEISKEECIFANQQFPCDEDIYELCEIIREEEGLRSTDDPYKAVDLYFFFT